MAVFTVSCRQHDIRTVIIRVPEIKNKTCEEIVRKALLKTYGIQKNGIQIDAEKRTVTVTYESLHTAIKNIEFAIAEAGFNANEVPANLEAVRKLPPECR